MHSLTLQTSEATVEDGDILGRLGFAASSETGTEALKIAGKIEAIAEEEFDGSNNATEMVFSLAADGTAAAKMTLSSAGLLTVVDDIVIKSGGTIGGANDTDLLTLGNGILTVAGEISVTTLDIGGTNVTATAAELNYVDGVTSAIQTQIDAKAASSHNHNASDINAGTLTHERGGIEADISAIAIGGILAGTGTGTMGIVSAASASDGDVLTIQADGTAAWEEPSGGGGGGGAVTALNNATENELVTVGATTTELDAESTLTYDGTTLQLSKASGAGVIRFENTDTAITADEAYGTIEFEGNDGNTNASGVRAKISVVADDSGSLLGTKGGTAVIMETAIDEVSGTTEYFRLNQNGRIGVNANATSNGEFDDNSRLYVYEALSSKSVCTLENKQSGTGGDLIVMRAVDAVKTVFDEQGYLHIGGSDPTYPLTVDANTNELCRFTRGNSGNAWIRVDGNQATTNEAQLRLVGGNAGQSRVFFGDTDSVTGAGGIQYKHSDNSMTLTTNNAAAVVIENDKTVDFKISEATDSGSDYNYDSKVLPIKVGGTQYYLQLYVAAGGGGGGGMP